MGKPLSLRFTDEEEEILMRSFAASGDPHLGPHIKRVYFDAIRPNTEALAAIRRDMEEIRGLLALLREGQKSETDSHLVTTILCGLYLMVWRSVPEPQRILVDKVIDVRQIEQYLQGGS